MNKNELLKGLADELKAKRPKWAGVSDSEYTLKQIGDVSIFLTQLASEDLEQIPDWDTARWLDDILVRRMSIDDDLVSIWGVLIWGVQDLNEQWTDPLFIQIHLNSEWDLISQYRMLLADKRTLPMKYESYTRQRGFWDVDFYSDGRWEVTERLWKFAIFS